MGHQTTLSGATSGVESGDEEVIDLETTPSCRPDSVLLGSNPRILLSVVPFFADKLVLCRMTECDGVEVSGNRVESALNDYTYLCPVHLRLYTERVALWQCRAEGRNDKGRHMNIDGGGVAECSSHLKMRLQTVAKMPEAERPVPLAKTITSTAPQKSARDLIHHAKAAITMRTDHPPSHTAKLHLQISSQGSEIHSVEKQSRRRSLPPSFDTDRAASSTLPKKAFHFADPVDANCKRFDEHDDSSDQDLEFLHNRDERKQRKKKPKTPRPKRNDPTPADAVSGRKNDATHQWQKL